MRRPSREKGIVGLVLLIIAAIVGIVIWVASSGSVDAREGAKLRNSSVYSSLVQQGQAIENGFSQLVAAGTAPETVQLTEVFSSTLTKPLVLPKESLAPNETALVSAVTGMTSGSWSLIQATDNTSGATYVISAAGPISNEICSQNSRLVGSTAGTLAAAFAATATITFTNGPVAGCVSTSDTKHFFMYPLARM